MRKSYADRLAASEARQLAAATASAAAYRCARNRACRAVVQAGRVLVMHARACPRYRPVILPPADRPKVTDPAAPAARFAAP